MKRSAAIAIAIFSFFAGTALCYGIPAASGPKTDCEGSVRALAYQGYKCNCSGGQLSCSGTTPQKSRSKSASESAQVKSMLVGGIFQGLLSNMLSSPDWKAGSPQLLMQQQTAAAQSARQAEERRQSEDAEFQAERDRLLDGYKGLEGTSPASFKEGTELDFKTLDGKTELMAVAARHPFDSASGNGKPVSGSASVGNGTPFFGDTMPEVDLRLLVDPDNDPRVVDLRNAVAYTVGNLKADESKSVPPNKRKPTENGEPIIEPPDCAALSGRLSGFLEQRNRFQKTITLAQNQVNDWTTTNRAALMNAAKDGIEYFTAGLLDTITNHGKAAERLQSVYTRNAAKMAAEGVDILALEAKIRRLQLLSSAGKVAEISSHVNDWQAFTKDGVTGLLKQFQSSNEEVKEILTDPKLGKYFQADSPELNTLLDISKMAAANNVLGKWVKRQLPVIGLTEISIKQLYNGTEWAASFYRLAKANDINGRVTESAKSLQKHIDDTRIALSECR